MKWTVEQIEALRRAGIDPACVPHPDEPPKRPVEPVTRDAYEDLADAEFAALRPVLPPEPRQAGAISNRAVLDGLLWVERTGKKLTQLPGRYGSAEAVRKRAERWAVGGDWDELLDRLDELDLSSSRREAVRRLAHAQARRGDRIRQCRLTASR